VTTLAVEHADAVVVPREPGLPYLRMTDVSAMRTAPGSVTCRDGTIEVLDTDERADIRLDASGCTVVPGFVDCHTHLPFVGWRADEYARKVAGKAYEAIAAGGGGIAASARMLAESSDEAVLDQSARVADEMLATGTTTFECKSGYGLSLDGEVRQLRLAAELGRRVPQATTVTALVAHAVPPGYDADTWLDDVETHLGSWRAAVPSLSALDVYVESIAFTNAHLERVATLARANGLALRAHVEQFACHRSVPVALAAGARSLDHLSNLHPDDVGPLAYSECAAVLLPAAELLADEHGAPGRELADRGAVLALATDCNPGTAAVTSIPVVIGLAVRRHRLTPIEALVAATLNPAWALGRSSDVGSIEPGKRADLVVLDCPLDHVAYRFGRNPVLAVVAAGELVWLRADDDGRLR
jgi:imidazolonepropionase